MPEGDIASVDSTAKVNEKAPVIKADPVPREASTEYEYTVYLFSTRSVEIADKTNKRFQEAGYQTQIYEHDTDGVIRYRIALPGFETRLAAKEFSDLIIGKLGVSDTWVGKALRNQ